MSPVAAALDESLSLKKQILITAREIMEVQIVVR